jgi:hypothetical protein
MVTQCVAQNLLSLYTFHLYTFLLIYRTDVAYSTGQQYGAQTLSQRHIKSVFSMEAAGESMGCAVGLAGSLQPVAVTAVAEDVPREPEPAGSAVELPSSAASFAAATNARH